MHYFNTLTETEILNLIKLSTQSKIDLNELINLITNKDPILEALENVAECFAVSAPLTLVSA